MPVTIHKQFHLSGHQGSVYALAKQDENNFFSAGSEGLIVKWSPSEASDARAVAHIKGQVFSLYFSQHKNHLLAGTMNGILYVIDCDQKKEIKAIDTGSDSIFDIVYLAEKKLFALASKMGFINFFDEDYTLVQRLNITDNSLRSLAISPSLHLMAIAASDHKIYLFNCHDMKIAGQIDGPQHSVFSVAFSPDGKYLLAGSRDACIYVFDTTDDFKLVQKIPAHLFTINQILFHPSGKLFFTAGRDKHIKLWDAATFELLKVIDHEKYEGHTNSVNRLLCLSNGDLLISAGDDKTIIGWKIQLA